MSLIEIAVAGAVAAASAIIERVLEKAGEADKERAYALVRKRLEFRSRAQARLDERKRGL